MCGFEQNLMLATCLYEVEFPWGEITKFAADIITESMCAQCGDVNGTEYQLSKSFVDHKNNDTALSAENQKVIVKGTAGISLKDLTQTFCNG